MKTLSILSAPLIFHGLSLVGYTFSKSHDAGIRTPGFCPDNVPVKSVGMLLYEQVETNSA